MVAEPTITAVPEPCVKPEVPYSTLKLEELLAVQERSAVVAAIFEDDKPEAGKQLGVS